MKPVDWYIVHTEVQAPTILITNVQYNCKDLIMLIYLANLILSLLVYSLSLQPFWLKTKIDFLVSTCGLLAGPQGREYGEG